MSDTSAMPAGPRDSEPEKMTSSMARPRRCFADCSPMTHRMASTMFDLPQPLGPTIDVIGSGNEIEVLSTNDLKPLISMRLIFKCHPSGRPRHETAWNCVEAAGPSNGVTIHKAYRHRGLLSNT